MSTEGDPRPDSEASCRMKLKPCPDKAASLYSIVRVCSQLRSNDTVFWKLAASLPSTITSSALGLFLLAAAGEVAPPRFGAAPALLRLFSFRCLAALFPTVPVPMGKGTKFTKGTKSGITKMWDVGTGLYYGIMVLRSPSSVH